MTYEAFIFFAELIVTNFYKVTKYSTIDAYHFNY